MSGPAPPGRTASERVLVVEAEDVVGGSSRLSGGLMMAAGTRHQQALGIDDDGGSLFHDCTTLNHRDVEAGLICNSCASCVVFGRVAGAGVARFATAMPVGKDGRADDLYVDHHDGCFGGS